MLRLDRLASLAALIAGLVPAMLSAAPAPTSQPEDKAPLKTPVVASRQASPLLTNYYDGASRQKIAESLRGSINEEDLLLYLLVMEDPRPALYDDYMTETDATRRAALAEQVKQKINDYYYRLAFAEMDQGPALTEFEQQKIETMLNPVLEFVWLDRVIRPQVEVSANEMRLYHQNHPEEFLTPHMVRVRYIFRALEPTMTPAEVDEEEGMMYSLREVLEQYPEKFAEAARQYSQAPSAANGGEVPPFVAEEYFEKFSRSAFSLSIPNELSPVFRGPEGLFLVQMIEHILPRPISYEEGQAQLRKSVLKQEMTQMARYAMASLRENGRVEARFAYWNDLRDGDMIVRVGDRELTKAQFWKLYPSVIGIMGDLAGPELVYCSKRYVECELMRRDLASRGLAEDPRLARARTMAEKILHAARVEKRHLQERSPVAAPAGAPAPGPAAQMLITGIASRVRLFAIRGEIVNSRQYDATTLMKLRTELAGILQSYIAKSLATPPAAPAEPVDRAGRVPAVVRGVKQIEDERFTFSWQDLGWINPMLDVNLQNLLLNLGEGQFAPVVNEQNQALAYYVASRRGLSAEEQEQLTLRARRAHVTREQEAAVTLFRNGVAQAQGVSYTF